MKKLYLASFNENKRKEIQEFLSCQLLSPPKTLTYEETGLTLYENAYIKAQSCFHLTKESSLSDDSGLFLPDFPHLLGVQTALFHPNEAPLKRCEYLLKEIDSKETQALFKTVLCFFMNSKEIYFFEGEVEGVLTSSVYPGEGFGFDFIFRPKNSLKTYSEDPSFKKNEGHRILALKKAKDFLFS